MQTARLGWIVALGFVACGGETVERDAPEALRAKADVPTWFRHVTSEVACDTGLDDTFSGADSAHLFSFPADAGREVKIAFDPTYTAGYGAGIAVYDAATGDRVAAAQSQRSKATLAFVPAKSGKYLVGAYSASWLADGSYTLDFTCAPVKKPGKIVPGARSYIASADGLECSMPSVHCVTTDPSACPQFSPRPPGWCADGRIEVGAPSYIDSADGKECELPSVHCVTNDASACPQFLPLPPDWCKDGTIETGAPRFTASADGKECALPSVHCVTKDAFACPQISPLPPTFCQ